jgi:uncharacterized protein YqhQ
MTDVHTLLGGLSGYAEDDGVTFKSRSFWASARRVDDGSIYIDCGPGAPDRADNISKTHQRWLTLISLLLVGLFAAVGIVLDRFFGINQFLPALLALTILPAAYAVYFLNRNESMKAYHSAEHQVASAYSHAGELNLQALRSGSRYLAACGTTVKTMEVLGSALALLFFGLNDFFSQDALNQVIVGVGVMYGGQIAGGLWWSFFRKKTVAKWALAPGLKMQKYTTAPASDDHLLVSYSALLTLYYAQKESGFPDCVSKKALSERVQQEVTLLS